MSGSETKNPPLHFAVPLFPSFQALDLFGPLDALNTIPVAYPEYAGQLRLSIIASTLDPISTLPHSSFFEENQEQVQDQERRQGQGQGIQKNWTFEQKILPTHTFSNPPTNIDVILLPGGIGTRPQFQSTWQPIVDYLSSILYPSTSTSTSSSPQNTNPNLRAIFTICTGSLLLAHTGILTHKSATTNKLAFQRIKSLFPNVNWKPKARWVKDSIIIPSTTSHAHIGTTTTTTMDTDTETGHKIDIWTCSGVSAGLDGIFSFLSSEFNPTLSHKISTILEYEPKSDPNDDPFAAII